MMKKRMKKLYVEIQYDEDRGSEVKLVDYLKDITKLVFKDAKFSTEPLVKPMPSISEDWVFPESFCKSISQECCQDVGWSMILDVCLALKRRGHLLIEGGNDEEG